MLPTTLSILTNVVPKHERARTIAIWIVVGALGIGIGPVVGATSSTHLDWSLTFGPPAARVGVHTGPVEPEGVSEPLPLHSARRRASTLTLSEGRSWSACVSKPIHRLPTRGPERSSAAPPQSERRLTLCAVAQPAVRLADQQEAQPINAARTGNPAAFPQLTQPYY